MTGNAIIKIFLASSSELKDDREQFEIFINRKNKEYIEKDIFLELVLWEDFLDAMSPTRLQDEYNKAITECDVFVSLFHTKIGQYTEEEFLKALETFKANKRPLIYTYFKDSPINLSQITDEIRSLLDFKNKLDQLGHFYTKYNDIDHLKYLFDQQLTKFIPELIDRIKAAPEKPIESPKQQVLAFYVERPPIEENCYRAIVQSGALIRIKAPEKMGKTLLIGQIFERLNPKDYRRARVSLKELDKEDITHLERLLRCFCQEVSQELNLPSQVKEYWQEERGNKAKCTSYFEDYLLPAQKSPLVLAIDDVDWLFPHPTVCEDFCLMLRNWHEKAKTRQIWQQLRLIVAHSTEEYINLQDHHSPFNVGVPIELPEFTLEQVQAFAKHCELQENAIQMPQLIDLIGGHPYLVTLTFSYLKAHPNVTLEQLLAVAPTEQGIYSSHLRELLDTLQQNPDLKGAFKAVATATKPVSLETLTGHKLRSMGLIKWQEDRAIPSCQLYRKYFSERL
jgi:hypothetical protein